MSESRIDNLPGQIIYAAFMGIMLCLFGGYGSVSLVTGGSSPGWVTLGVVALVVCIGMAVAYAALLVRAVWAARISRMFTIVLLFGLAAALIIGLVNVISAEETSLLDDTLIDRMLNVLLSTPVLLPLIGILIAGAILRLLMGKTSLRFFGQ